MGTTENKGKRPRRREMEGPIARYYAKLRGSASQLEAVRRSAERFAAGLPAGADVLEIAPGPGYHAVELARLGLNVTGFDISHTFVQIASDYARKEAVSVDFRQGNAADLPFGDGEFDLIVCQAAFKNFTEPLKTLNEMHRVLRPGATAVVEDMRKEASSADIDAEVRGAGVGLLKSVFMRTTLTGLRHRAFSQETFRALAAQSAFGGCEITGEGIGMEIRLARQT